MQDNNKESILSDLINGSITIEEAEGKSVKLKAISAAKKLC